MKIVYVSDDIFVIEATVTELQKIQGDENYAPQVGDQINVDQAWDAFLWIRSKKSQINNAGTQLVALAKKL